MAANRIFIQVDFQTQSANAAIGALNQNLASIGTAAQGATQQATAGVKGFSVSVDQTSRSLEQLSAAVAGVGVIGFTQRLIVMGDQLNRVQRAFEGVAGGAQALQEIRQIAEASRFSFEDMAANANQMRNFGVAMKDIPGVMRAFAGAVDQAAGNTDDLSKAVHAFGQMTSQQFVNAKSVYQSFGAVGLQIMQMLRDQTHKTVQEVREDTRLLNTEVLSQMIVIQARIKSLEAGPVGESISARFGQLLTSVNALAQELDRALGPSLGKVLGLVDSLVQGLTDLTKAFAGLPEPVKDVAVGLAALASAGLAVAGAFAAWRGIAGVIGGLTALASGAETAVAGVAAEAAGAGGILAAIAALPLAPTLAVITGIIGAVAILMSLGEKAQAKAPPKSAAAQQIADLKKQLDDLGKGVYAPDDKKIEEANKRGQDLLDEAQRRSLVIGKQSIAALTYAYDEHFRAVAASAKAVAMARKALEIDVATEVAKRGEELQKENEKAAQESLVLVRKIQVARAEVTPDDTFVGRAQIANLQGSAEEDQIREQYRLKTQHEEELTQKQIEGVRASSIAEAAKIADIAKLQSDVLTYHTQQNILADEAVALHRLESEKRVNELLEEQRKQLVEQDLQDQLSSIEQTRTLRAAMLGAATAESLPERLQQLRELTQNQIAATQQARDARIASARSEFEYFKQQHPGADDKINEEQGKFDHIRITTAREAEVQIQLDRINLWKESNDAIIAEQKKVYEGIKSALDKVWDALLNKSQSVWAALGNALKTAVLNAMKEIVTSRLAASIAEAFGYGTYSFKRGITGITEPPSPSGLGTGPPVATIAAVTSGLVVPGGGGAAGAGGGAGGPAASVTGEIGQYVRAAQTEAATQADTARMQQPGGATSGGYTGGGYSGGYSVAPWAAPSTALGQATMASGSSSGAPPAATGGGMQMQQSIQRLRSSLNIGKPIISDTDTIDALGNPVPAGTAIPWANATAGQRLDTVLHSQGVATLGMTLGGSMVLSGLRHAKTAMGTAQIFGGAAMAGAGAASMFPALGLSMAGGALLGVGVGSLAYGLARGGKVGLGFDVAGGALTGALLGTALFPGIGTLAGAAIGAGVGALAGIVRMFSPTLDERVRNEVKRVYGIDIPNAGIRKQIADITNQKYGGNLSIALYSPDVQDLVRLYAISTGQSTAGLPRPMYSATFAQSQTGGLQLQPVYSNGQLVSNPYVGTTSTQLQQALYANPSIYMQLHPQQAADLFSGQVVRVIGNNPASVAQANTAATRAGTNRLAQSSALMEPMTVTQ